MKVDLVGVHCVKKKLAKGGVATYYYAWRGGPRMTSEFNSVEFVAEYVRLMLIATEK